MRRNPHLSPIVFALVALLGIATGCHANTASINGDGIHTTAQPASLASMNNDGEQQASFQGVAPTQLKQDADGNWLTTPGQGGTITFPTAQGPVLIWSPKDAIITGLSYTPQPNAGEASLVAATVEFNLSNVADIYAEQFAFAMDAIKDMTRAEAEARVRQLEAAGAITSDIASLLLGKVIPLIP